MTINIPISPASTSSPPTLEQSAAKNTRMISDYPFAELLNQQTQRLTRKEDENLLMASVEAGQFNSWTAVQPAQNPIFDKSIDQTDISNQHNNIASVSKRSDLHRTTAARKDDTSSKADNTDSRTEKSDRSDAPKKDDEVSAKTDAPSADQTQSQGVAANAQPASASGETTVSKETSEASVASSPTPLTTPIAATEPSQISQPVEPMSVQTAAAELSATDVSSKTGKATATTSPIEPQITQQGVDQTQTAAASSQPTGPVLPTAIAAASYTQSAVPASPDVKSDAGITKIASEIDSASSSAVSAAPTDSSASVQAIAADHPGVQVSTTTAQIAEPARTAEARASEMIQQITKQLSDMKNNGQTTLRMQLFPENMGRIDLRMTTNGHNIGVTIIADQSDTSRLLQRNLDNLRQNLNDAGIQINQLDISSHGGFQQSGSESKTANPSTSGFRTSNQNFNAPKTEISSPRRNLESSVYDYQV